MLLGTPKSGRMGGPTPYSLRTYYAAWFAQDDWKITHRLTLNIGVRYELETPYTERYDRIFYGFDSTVASPLQLPGMNLRGAVRFAGLDGTPRTEGPWTIAWVVPLGEGDQPVAAGQVLGCHAGETVPAVHPLVFRIGGVGESEKESPAPLSPIGDLVFPQHRKRRADVSVLLPVEKNDGARVAVQKLLADRSDALDRQSGIKRQDQVVVGSGI